ncbi:hypothetical protein RJ641_029688 [Dillenia turbinata]|uniref:Synaptonemal complex protein 1 n=1 Tax=Dillenia turbinata TaxID=194707 RepID=A0AAN8ZJR3_9MAGN
MNKLGFSGMRSLDQLNSLSGSRPVSTKIFSASSRPSSDSLSSGSFANLKLTAEKLVKEQASVKTDLEMANAKLKKSLEHIRNLEEKLQNAFNENARLRVKQKEDEKLWQGLESKFSSTKTLCDQLTETLQHLACLVQEGPEKDKEDFESKLSASSVAVGELNNQMKNLSLKLECAEENVNNRERELKDLKSEKEQMEKIYRDEQQRIAHIIEEKDAIIKHSEATLAADGLAIENLKGKLEGLHLELRSKDEACEHLRTAKESLLKEKGAIQANNDDLAKRIAMLLQEIKNLEEFVCGLAAKIAELDGQSSSFSKKVVKLQSVYDSFFELIQKERELSARRTKNQNDQLTAQLLHMTSERDSLQLTNQELSNKVFHLQKVQEDVMVQHAEECRLAEDRIRLHESEKDTLSSKKIELEIAVSKLEDKIKALLESSRSSEDKMQDLLLKLFALEAENKELKEKLQEQTLKREEDIDVLKKEIVMHEQHIDSQEKQMSQLQNDLEEKRQLILQLKEREKQLSDQNAEVQSMLAAAESKLVEAKKQYDVMLESKQLELSRHLKEISQRNDQAINEIRKKYEVEKQEVIKFEKEKANKAIAEMEKKCDQQLVKSKEESLQHLKRIQEEQAALIISVRHEHENQELKLKADHTEELKHVQFNAEHHLREKLTHLRNEHEVQIRALKRQHEDECQKLQEELDLQKSKEDRQRALLQLQWKVMSDKPQEDQEVNSEKGYSVSSIKMKSSKVNRRPRRGQESPILTATQTPVTNLLKTVEKANSGSRMAIPKHSRKVTHHEYEVETSNGKTITKRRKTKSTVMFGNPKKHLKLNTPKVGTPRDAIKGIKISQNHSNIGDLFSEGSLNPYADDPYAFD